MHTTPQPDDDAAALGMRLARANAIAFVTCTHALSAEERIEFVRAFFSCLAGMAEHSIGHQASRDVFAFVSALRSIADTTATH